jgi:hypothetical protein
VVFSFHADSRIDEGANYNLTMRRGISQAGERGYVRLDLRGDAINVKAPSDLDLPHINDAEMHLWRAAEAQGATINAIGATRPVCVWCQTRLPDSIPIVTELKS